MTTLSGAFKVIQMQDRGKRKGGMVESTNRSACRPGRGIIRIRRLNAAATCSSRPWSLDRYRI